MVEEEPVIEVKELKVESPIELLKSKIDKQINVAVIYKENGNGFCGSFDSKYDSPKYKILFKGNMWIFDLVEKYQN